MRPLFAAANCDIYCRFMRRKLSLWGAECRRKLALPPKRKGIIFCFADDRMIMTALFYETVWEVSLTTESHFHDDVTRQSLQRIRWLHGWLKFLCEKETPCSEKFLGGSDFSQSNGRLAQRSNLVEWGERGLRTRRGRGDGFHDSLSSSSSLSSLQLFVFYVVIIMLSLIGIDRCISSLCFLSSVAISELLI